MVRTFNLHPQFFFLLSIHNLLHLHLSYFQIQLIHFLLPSHISESNIFFFYLLFPNVYTQSFITYKLIFISKIPNQNLFHIQIPKPLDLHIWHITNLRSNLPNKQKIRQLKADNVVQKHHLQTPTFEEETSVGCDLSEDDGCFWMKRTVVGFYIRWISRSVAAVGVGCDEWR